MSFSPDASAIEALYFENADDMYRLAFIHTSISFEASKIVNNTFSDILTNEKVYNKAFASRESLMKLIYNGCMDFYRRKARKKIKPEKLREMRVPFKITDLMVEILHLQTSCKAPLMLDYMGFSLSEISFITDKSENSAQRSLDEALKRMEGSSKEEISAELESMVLSKETYVRNIDKLLYERGERGFAASQKLRRFKRKLDIAIPFIAIAVIGFIVFAIFYTAPYY